MKTRQYLFIGLALIVLFFLGRSLFFEQVEIQNFPNESSYEYFNKDIQDLYVFRSLLENDFEEVEVYNSINDVPFTKDGEIGSNIIVDEYLSITDQLADSLWEMAYEGQTIVLAANIIEFQHYELNVSTNQTLRVDSVHLEYSQPPASLTFREERAKSYGYNIRQHNFDIIEDYPRNYPIVNRFKKYTNSLEAENKTEDEAMIADTSMRCFHIINGNICFYNFPYALSNLASLDKPYYLQNYRRFKSIIPDGKVNLIKAPYAAEKAKSPFRFLLAKRSFRWAYYLGLILLLIYVFAESRRKYRAVPVLKMKENTTLDFVDTIARLYQKQDRADKLKERMKQNFYNFIDHRYFIRPNEEDFWVKLARKSKVHESLLTRIQHEFKEQKQKKEGNQQIISFYKILNMFYKTAE